MGVVVEPASYGMHTPELTADAELELIVESAGIDTKLA